ncbi:T9SS type A sorting domain-containing protein [Flavobacteriaceae bacterium Ap0902]|nr:T9SS type A sorting domain-containing protein [Flavobacteriaceae bacterium Ap0902]
MKHIYNLKSICFAFLLLGGLLNAQYSNGIIVGNEGNFGYQNAEISFIDYTTLEITNDIYKTVNNEDLGNVLQNVNFNNEYAYLVINASNVIKVVNRETFEKQFEITEGLDSPRYIAFNNGKYYVTNMGSRAVNVYSQEDNSLLSIVDIDKTTEEIESIGNYVFVQNASFGTGKVVSAIETETDTVAQLYDFEGNVLGIESDGAYLYVVSTEPGYTDLHKIDAETLEVVAETRFDGITAGRKLAVSDNIVFFIGNGTNVYGISDDLEGEPTLITSVPDNSWNTFYGFNVLGDYILSADSQGFVDPSEIRIFNVEDGEEIQIVHATIGVNDFYNNQIEALSTNDVVDTSVEVVVYPNPVMDVVNLKGVDTAAIEVYDINGRLVKKLNYKGASLHVGDLASGLYFFAITTEQGRITKKVLVK